MGHDKPTWASNDAAAHHVRGNAMTPDQVTSFTSPFSQTVLGVACVALIYAYLKLWAKYDAREKEFEVKLAQKEALIYEQYEKRIANNAILVEALRDNNKQMASLQQTTGEVTQ